MALFEFQLCPLEELPDWGEEPHWFGLTDGVYYLNLGGQEVFRFSGDILDHWGDQEQPSSLPKEYVNYPVVRLYEDSLDILPDVLQPVPPDLAEYIRTPTAQQQWEAGLSWARETDNDELYELYYQATAWWAYRHLSTLHLNQGPKICLWREDDSIHVRWNNKECTIEGIQPWHSITGEEEFSLQVFLGEIDSFHNRLMTEMQSRIAVLCSDTSPARIKNVDTDSLRQEQQRRKESLTQARKRSPNVTDWEQVREANKNLIRTA